jgi:hypothetical protein
MPTGVITPVAPENLKINAHAVMNKNNDKVINKPSWYN